MFIGYCLVNSISNNGRVIPTAVFRDILSFMSTDHFDLWLEAVKTTNDDGYFKTLDDVIYFKNKFYDVGYNFSAVSCYKISPDTITQKIQEEDNFIGYDICDKHFQSILLFYGYSNLLRNEPNYLDVRSLLTHHFSIYLNSHRYLQDLDITLLVYNIETMMNQTGANGDLCLESKLSIYKYYEILLTNPQLT